VTGALLDGAFRFETFVIGASNRLAAAAARAVADAPGSAYNPLFVYGGSGLGKTHLVAAIAFHARHGRPDLRAEFTTGEELAEQLGRAVASGNSDGFVERFQHVDLLLLDDVQFLTGQRETQGELLRLVNRLQLSGRQVVMTSDRPPAEIPDVDERLLSRLSGGLVVDVGAPDYEMRLAILRNACGERAVTFADGVLDAVARLPFRNVRELKGALNRLTAYQQLDGTEVRPADVRAVLGERAPAHRRTVAVLPGAGTEAGADFEGFLADVTQELERRVDPWRIAIGEAVARWRAEGYDTRVLERALALPNAPDVQGLLDTYAAAVARLQALEAEAVAIDPGQHADAVFRDPAAIPAAEARVAEVVSRTAPLPRPDPALTRASLESGTANRLALRALEAVVAAPGQQFNPLVVHGERGSGKTHLLHALAHALGSAHPGRAVACIGARAFADEYVQAMQAGRVERWRARYRTAGVFVLDDVHLLAELERTQDELFHLFNHLHARGCQLVLSADRPVGAILGLVDRLRSRFEGGLVVALPPPDRDLRTRLAARWLAESGQPVEPAAADWFASQVTSDLRALRRLVAGHVEDARRDGAPITLARLRGDGVGAAALADARAIGSADAPDAFFLDREKTVWDWPDLGERLIEELR
jgi:chromosomal replication initiation ATPase DnaA